MRTDSKNKSCLNDDKVIEHHRNEKAKNWRNNLGFREAVQRLNKGYRFRTRH